MAFMLLDQGLMTVSVLCCFASRNMCTSELKYVIAAVNVNIVYLQGPANRGVQEKSAYSPVSNQAWRPLRALARAPALRAVLYR